MQYLRYSWLCLFIALCLMACKKVEEVAPPLDPGLSWQFNTDFLFGDKIQLSSYADSTLIILSGTQTTAIAPGEQRPKADTTFTHYGGVAQPGGRMDYRPLLSSSFVAFLNNDVVSIVPTASPVLEYSFVDLHMAQLDADFAGFYTLTIDQGETMVVNRQHQLIVPYQRYDRSYSTPVINGDGISIALVSVNVPAPPQTALTVEKTQLITFNKAGWLVSLSSAGDYFIISTTGGTFRMAPDGTYQRTYPYPLQRQFSLNGTLYGITNANTRSSKLVASTDQGVTWAVLVDPLPDAYQQLTFKAVNNQLIAAYNSQLFQLQVSANTLTTTELDNTNLFGNRITSVAAFRNTVYVSTLSGVFTKPLRTFLLPKQKT